MVVAFRFEIYRFKRCWN